MLFHVSEVFGEVQNDPLTSKKQSDVFRKSFTLVVFELQHVQCWHVTPEVYLRWVWLVFGWERQLTILYGPSRQP